MRAFGNITIDIRVQAVTVYLLAAVWHGVLWLSHRSGANLAVVLEGLYFLLPLVTTLLAVIILESRVRHHQRCTWWVYMAVFVGLVPWIWYACYNLSG
jgi:hypothetical protein